MRLPAGPVVRLPPGPVLHAPVGGIGPPKQDIVPLQRASAAGPVGTWCLPGQKSQITAWMNAHGQIGFHFTPCPDTAPTPHAAEPTTTTVPDKPATPGNSPQTLAYRFWRTITLPTPKPTIPPGWAITGKTAYLVTGDTNRPAPYDDKTPIGELIINAVGTYQVNWGDGTTTGPYTTPGLPWPSGTITHTYDNVGTYQVTVTQTWTATWQLGNNNGTLTGITTTATIPHFRARQIQAVLIH